MCSRGVVDSKLPFMDRGIDVACLINLFSTKTVYTQLDKRTYLGTCQQSQSEAWSTAGVLKSARMECSVHSWARVACDFRSSSCGDFSPDAVPGVGQSLRSGRRELQL
eukprot:4392236-Amphidinium_carterae.1